MVNADDPCLRVNGNGIEYQEFSCLYPALEPLYLRYVDTTQVCDAEREKRRRRRRHMVVVVVDPV